MSKVIDSTNLGYLIGKMKAAFLPKSNLEQVGVDAVPTEDSTNLVESGGVYDFVGDPVTDITAPTPYDGTFTFETRSGDTVTVDLNHSHPQYYSKVAESSQPAGGFLPDVVYELGELTGSVTFALASAVSGNVNHYFWTFETGASAPTVSWPAGITWLDGSAPTPGASKHCEVSILGGVGVYMEA